MLLDFLIIVESFLLAAVSVLFIAAVKKNRKKYTIQKRVLENTIAAQCKEIEKQSTIINNLAGMSSEAIEIDKQKSELFTNIIHELKTPLCVILGALKLIEQKNLSDMYDERVSSKHFQTIRQNCYRLIRLVNNILDIAKIDSGYLKVNLINCNIAALIEEITRSVASYAEQKKIMLDFASEEEEIITAVDIEKMDRIILNLLSNAIKFTNAGGRISVGVKSEPGKVIISVKDTGLGIPKNRHKDIFERFVQVNGMMKGEHEGSGIGLFLVKSFVEFHNGKVFLVSEEYKGSEFIIEIPIKYIESKKDDSASKNTSDKVLESVNIEFMDVCLNTTDKHTDCSAGNIQNPAFPG